MYDNDGVLDNAFGNNGIYNGTAGENAYNDIANSIHVDSINNKIYVIGDMEI